MNDEIERWRVDDPEIREKERPGGTKMYKRNKGTTRCLAEAIRKSEECRDPRPYAKIKIGNIEITGLLDSGASLSLLGKGCREVVERLGCKIHKYCTNIRTASGHKKRVLGKIVVEVKYKEKIGVLVLYLCPDLEQECYLGIDFWKLFEIAPEIISVDEIRIEQIYQNFGNSKCPIDRKMHDLSEEQKERLKRVVSKFPTFEEKGLGLTSFETHTIKLLEGAMPIKDKYYPISPAMQEIVYAEIDKMLELNVIEESESAWSNRTTIVRKPGKNRFCLDARKLNAVTEKDAYPLQNIDGILSRIDQTIFISSVDLKHAFWQIPLDDESKKYTAFTIPGRPLYQFRVMPFGLCNAAQRLCRLMDKVIPARLKNNVFVYLDDLLIISDEFDSHMKILEDVSECLTKANLTIGLTKSMFCFKELRYLGFIIGGGELKTDPEKVTAIQNIPTPKNPRQVRSFLGTAGWYRRFIKNYASMAAALTDTLKKSTKFTMTPAAEESFHNLKQALTTAPVLKHPDFTKRFFIQCDASESGIGAVLFQKGDEGEENPIAFYSQKLNGCQRNYSVTEKECLAAVMAIKRFRAYVELMSFTVITDHASLKWLMNMKDLSGRLARWSLQLQTFSFEIEHRRGKDNVVADMLSRMPQVDEITETNALFDFETNEFEGEEYKELLKNVEENKERLPDLKIKDGLVFKRTKAVNHEEIGELVWKLWVPDSLTHILIQKAHDDLTSAHGGVGKTIYRLRKLYYWPGMVSQVRRYVSNCTVCKETKPCNRPLHPTMGDEVITERPFQKLYIDFLGKYPRSKGGNSYIFIVVDHFTKFTFLKAMKEASTRYVVKFLIEDIFRKFGVPEIIHSDNGPQFTSKQFQEMINTYGIDHLRTAPYSPQSNASERVNQSVIAAIRAYLENDHRDWDLYLTEIECALRSSVHATTGVTPFFALFGYEMYTNGSDYKLARKLKSLTDHTIWAGSNEDRGALIREKIRRNMHNAYEVSSKRYNERARRVKLIPGQEVYRRNYVQSNFSKNFNAKFARKFLRCRITRPVGNNIYEIEDLQGRPLGNCHAKDLKT